MGMGMDKATSRKQGVSATNAKDNASRELDPSSASPQKSLHKTNTSAKAHAKVKTKAKAARGSSTAAVSDQVSSVNEEAVAAAYAALKGSANLPANKLPPPPPLPKISCSKTKRADGSHYYVALTYRNEYNPVTKITYKRDTEMIGKINSSDGIGVLEFNERFLNKNPTFRWYEVRRHARGKFTIAPKFFNTLKPNLVATAASTEIDADPNMSDGLIDQDNSSFEVTPVLGRAVKAALPKVIRDPELRDFDLEGALYGPQDDAPLDNLGAVYFNGGLVRHLGIQFTVLRKGYVEARIPVTAAICRYTPSGLILHGGASLAIAETIAGLGSMLICPPDTNPCGVSIAANHVRMVRYGSTIKAIATIIHQGNNSHLWNVDLFDHKGRVCSSARVSNAIVAERRIAGKVQAKKAPRKA